MRFSKYILLNFLLFFSLLYASEIEDEINNILSTNLNPVGKLITYKKFRDYNLLSLYLSFLDSDSHNEAYTFVVEGDSIVAKIKGVPVKINSNYLYTYDRYNFFRYSFDNETILKEKRLNADFFKRIHRKNIIIIDGIKVLIDRDTGELFLEEKEISIRLPLPKYVIPNVLNFHYCEGNLLGIFPLSQTTRFFLIDVNNGKIIKRMKLPKNEMVGFYACVDNKLLVFKEGLRFLNWDGRYEDLPTFTLKPEKKVLKEILSEDVGEYEEIFRYKGFIALYKKKNITKNFKIKNFPYTHHTYENFFKVISFDKKSDSFSITGYLENIWSFDKTLFVSAEQLKGFTEDKNDLLFEKCIYSFPLEKGHLEKIFFYQTQPKLEFENYKYFKYQILDVVPSSLERRFFLTVNPGSYCVEISFSGECTRYKNFEGDVYLLDEKKNILWRKHLNKKSKIYAVVPEGVIYKNEKKELILLTPDGKDIKLYTFKTKYGYADLKEGIVLINDSRERYSYNLLTGNMIKIPKNCTIYFPMVICRRQDRTLKNVINLQTEEKLRIHSKNLNAHPICSKGKHIMFYHSIYSRQKGATKKVFISVYSVKDNKLVDLLEEYPLSSQFFCSFGNLLEFIKNKQIKVYSVEE